MKLKNIALTISLALISGGALAHGYVEKPESRAYMCKLNKQMNCGRAQWEPQSIEQTKGFPVAAKPADGQLASAGVSGFEPLDRQSVSEWLKTDIKPGRNEFRWYHTALHATTKWQYFITKQDWDVNKPLTRDSFEAKPFCEIDGKGLTPETVVTHVCDVPQRTGYQIIYAVWEIDNTANSFYQVIDVNFPADNNGDDPGQEAEWSKQLNGAIYGQDLNKGDKVIARFIDNNGQEVSAMQTALEISNVEQGAMQRWSHDLAEKLNASHSDIRVGVKDQSGEINPAYGTNNVYVRTSSNLQSVVISYELSHQEIKESITLSDAQASDIVEGKSEVSLKADVTGDVTLEATVSDHAGANKGFLKETFSTGEYPLSIALNNVQAGHHILRYVATNPTGQVIEQGTQDLQLKSGSTGGDTGDYDFTFPDKLKSYKAGTVVLQPKDGHTYECKPFPYSGYCQQWSASANHYEPGVGSHWKDAWTLKK
ncbi:N-acetylglucosamine-binding protein GbpA [Pantoea sp.]|uniref:N-acetylglucosamine-binding protein GbpA n=1 Tax=Pantoea sp. TaxID=69393 RepID=UPI00289AAF94|nr:N-acetylglucosamine-binding protein GbpA [Pantoea sp.]